MKKWLVILFVVVSPAIFAQELLMPDLPEIDSLDVTPQHDLINRQLFPSTFLSTDLMEPVQVPDIDFNAALADRWTYNVSENLFNPVVGNGLFPGLTGPAFIPFVHSGSVFSSAAYKLNDKFTVGGYSFGANSVFTAPFPNRGINSYDFQGSTLFMKYKVSKNFKIETRVNVTHGPGPGF